VQHSIAAKYARSTASNSRFISALSTYSYILDWFVYVVILVAFVIYGSVVPPRFHEFLVDDSNLMYSYKVEEETAIQIPMLLFISVGIPMVLILACAAFNRTTLSTIRMLWDIHIGLLTLLGAMATQLTITCVLKNICGLPRPDLISRCVPDLEIDEPSLLSTVEICSNMNLQIVFEGFRSFPSGHLSTVFCGMIVTSLYISGQLQVFDMRGMAFKVLLAISPIVIACFVSCTRISDNRHFLRDVIGGSIIGLCIGTWFYLQYFPSVFDLENGGRAFPPRRIGVANYFNNVGGFWKIDDELPGSFDARHLNSKVLQSIVEEFENPGQYLDLENVPQNIQLINKLSMNLGNRVLNVTNTERV
jgi:diacylglycerol diphosphate phosphatase/phosphatidate phosphatase